MEKDIITYCLIALLGLLFSIVMYLIMKYKSSKSSQKSKQIVKITFIFVILMSITSAFVFIFSIYNFVENDLGLEGIVKGLF
ncbi:MAG: hypothetical protein V8S10_03210 [Clostridia bacterium]|jgi:heme/copper-type cytochrome/quinol oxidase subunit 2